MAIKTRTTTLLLLWIFQLFLTVTCQTDFSIQGANRPVWNQTAWSLTSYIYTPGQYQARSHLSNGYVGASLASAGPFFEIDVNQTDPNGIVPSNGWPLFDYRISFATISGFYDVEPGGNKTGGSDNPGPGTNFPERNDFGWESFISGIPHPTDLIFAFGEHQLDATAKNTTISNYKSTLSFATGVKTWDYTWQPEGSETQLNVSYEVVFHREHANIIAVRAVIISSQDVNGTVTDLLDGRSATRTCKESKGLDDNGTSIYSAVHPNGLTNVTGWVVSTADFEEMYTDLSSRAEAAASWLNSNESTVGQTFNISLKEGKEAVFLKYVGVASTDKFPDAEIVARESSAFAAGRGWDSLLEEHKAAWAQLLTPDSVDDFRDPKTGALPEDDLNLVLHIASVTNAYYLLQELQPDGSMLNDNSIAVGGLASDSYAGMVFWDADYWMAPGINLAFPAWAEQIPNFRVKQHAQALKNAEAENYPPNSSLYSWTTGRYGNCTGTGPCVDYEYHLNYDIAFNMFQLRNITQNQTWFDNGPRDVIESTAHMTAHLLKYNSTTQSYWIHNMTDPDEYANFVDNGLFTIASAATLLELTNDLLVREGLEFNATWDDIAKHIEFPRAESQISLEYTGMNNSVEVKQADVVLLTYPLDYTGSNYLDTYKLQDLDYYSNKQSPDGPAMTYSVFAINANILSPSGCASYTYTLHGTHTYLRAPWYHYSEQSDDNIATNGDQDPAFPFITGLGGANQIVPFGYLGLRTDQEVLHLDPSLPPQIANVRVRTFYFAGAAISAVMNATHTTLTRRDTSRVKGVTDKYGNTTLPFTVGSGNSTTSYSLALNSTLTIPNRLNAYNVTYAGNILQCLPVTSPDLFVAGQFPTGVADGATATVWQPKTNLSASVTIDLSTLPFREIGGFYFDWAARVPESVKVVFGNKSDVVVGGQDNPSVTERTYIIENIMISRPFNGSEDAGTTATEVVVYKGNETSVTFDTGEGGWTGEYVRLEIEGCVEGDGEGATVSEFVVLGL